jgi:hypothetical protein
MTRPETARSTGRGPQCQKPVEASAADRVPELAPLAPTAPGHALLRLHRGLPARHRGARRSVTGKPDSRHDRAFPHRLDNAYLCKLADRSSYRVPAGRAAGKDESALLSAHVAADRARRLRAPTSGTMSRWRAREVGDGTAKQSLFFDLGKLGLVSLDGQCNSARLTWSVSDALLQSALPTNSFKLTPWSTPIISAAFSPAASSSAGFFIRACMTASFRSWSFAVCPLGTILCQQLIIPLCALCG